MLFEQLGTEWARHTPDTGAVLGRAAERTVRGALKASALGELAAFTREHGVELLQNLPGLIELARTDVLSGKQETEHIGRVLIALGAHSPEGQAAGHFLIGYALRFPWGDGPRHFEQARLAYRDLGSRTRECLSALAAEAARMDLQTRDASVDALATAFDGLAQADEDCARRVAAGVDRFLTVLRVARGLVEESAPPADLPDVTEDDINVLRSAMAAAAIQRPERVAPIARWIQSLRGLPADSSAELDAMAAMLGDVHAWEPRIQLLQDMVAHGDRRPETLIQLSRSLVEVGRWSEAKALLTAGIGDRPGAEHVELLQFLVMFCLRMDDPDASAWAAKLRALGGELPAQVQPPPSQVEEVSPTPPPPLLASFENGRLTLDPRLAELGQEAIATHMRAAMILGLGPEEGARLRDDIAVKEPALFSKIVELLPPYARPRSVAEEHLATAEDHFANRRYREAVSAYRTALDADPELEYAHLGLGDTYYMLGDFHLAVAHFTESIAIRPTPQAYRFLGDAILRSQGDRKRARHCYEQALALDPGYGGAREALARLTPESRGGPAGGQ